MLYTYSLLTFAIYHIIRILEHVCYVEADLIFAIYNVIGILEHVCYIEADLIMLRKKKPLGEKTNKQTGSMDHILAFHSHHSFFLSFNQIPNQ